MDDSMSGATAIAALVAGGALHGARDVRGGAGCGLRGRAQDGLVGLLLWIRDGAPPPHGHGCSSKNAHLKVLEGAEERLQLVKADLLDYHSVASAIASCDGVFHVACPVPSGRSTDYEAEIIAPAVTGTLNVLKACHEAKVKRVVMVSSGAAVVANPNWPKGKACDEESWSDEGYCRKNGDWYYLSKTLAEREAFAYAAKTGLDIVTICPSLVIGPLMQSTVNSSSKVLLNYLKGKLGEMVQTDGQSCGALQAVLLIRPFNSSSPISLSVGGSSSGLQHGSRQHERRR
ncbi:cinnamoyl-CoA reductase 1-like [Triticum urartu]|uniref:cinnamoyl-CoA reductase 1-like n=1 Tax=Triticum urartu TaxID=4572 RepID=UPI0020441668|nr:cinnamoyl-CoA reductase 1-like [Triticum urartu]